MIKKLLLSTITLLTCLNSSAVTLDVDTFGNNLNGWRKNRTAHYTIDNHTYRTHKPTVTPTPAGGAFISTRVEFTPILGKKTTSFIELNYSASGTLISAQIRITSGKLRMNTGLITRPTLAAVPAEGEAPIVNDEPWVSTEGQMVRDLFTALDTEFQKLAKKDLEGKKDVFSRVFGKGDRGEDLAAALRHNLNLLIANTH